MATPPARAVVPYLTGSGVLMRPARRRGCATESLHAAGYTTVEVDSTGITERRELQAALTEALALPQAAASNLDAFVDTLRDLQAWWPHTGALALVWSGTEAAIGANLPAWLELVDILTGAVRAGRAPRFEVIVAVDGFGVGDGPGAS